MKKHWQQQNGNGIFCETCGNEISYNTVICPYCNSKQQTGRPDPVATGTDHRLVNLEHGLPVVAQALKRLETEIETSRSLGLKVLTVIHGYGSSGRGGKIRMEVRRQLEFMKLHHTINDFLTGEEFKKRSPKTSQLLRRFPFLNRHSDLNRANRGITLIIF